jgi:hypothetical protein
MGLQDASETCHASGLHGSRLPSPSSSNLVQLGTVMPGLMSSLRCSEDEFTFALPSAVRDAKVRGACCLEEQPASEAARGVGDARGGISRSSTPREEQLGSACCAVLCCAEAGHGSNKPIIGSLHHAVQQAMTPRRERTEEARLQAALFRRRRQRDWLTTLGRGCAWRCTREMGLRLRLWERLSTTMCRE